MAEKNIVPSLEAKATDGNPLFTPRQWLERFRQFCKRKHQKRHCTVTERRRNHSNRMDRKRTSNSRRLLMESGTEALYQITMAKYETEPYSIKMKKLIRLYTEFYMPKRNTYHNRGDFFWAKQTKRQKNFGDGYLKLKKSVISIQFRLKNC